MDIIVQTLSLHVFVMHSIITGIYSYFEENINRRQPGIVTSFSLSCPLSEAGRRPAEREFISGTFSLVANSEFLAIWDEVNCSFPRLSSDEGNWSCSENREIRRNGGVYRTKIGMYVWRHESAIHILRIRNSKELRVSAKSKSLEIKKLERRGKLTSSLAKDEVICTWDEGISA